jgi:hypothetical protein
MKITLNKWFTICVAIVIIFWCVFIITILNCTCGNETIGHEYDKGQSYQDSVDTWKYNHCYSIKCPFERKEN